PRKSEDEWPLYYGSEMEPVIRKWYERNVLGFPLTEVGRVVHHPKLPVSATLDGFDVEKNRVVEIKTTAWSLHWAIGCHTPQLVLQHDCRGGAEPVMVISVGGREPIELEHVDLVGEYKRELHARIAAFLI